MIFYKTEAEIDHDAGKLFVGGKSNAEVAKFLRPGRNDYAG